MEAYARAMAAQVSGFGELEMEMHAWAAKLIEFSVSLYKQSPICMAAARFYLVGSAGREEEPWPCSCRSELLAAGGPLATWTSWAVAKQCNRIITNVKLPPLVGQISRPSESRSRIAFDYEHQWQRRLTGEQAIGRADCSSRLAALRAGRAWPTD